MTRLPVGLVDTYSAPVAPWGPSLQMTGVHYGAGWFHIAGVIGSSQVSPIIWLVLSLTVCFISIF
jgi:uncharacterized membrane protein